MIVDTIDDLRKSLREHCVDLMFKYNERNCLIFPETVNQRMVYHMCYGNDDKDFYDIDTLIKDKLFDGNSLEDIIDEIEIAG